MGMEQRVVDEDVDMKEHVVKISQNGWEYTGFAYITCTTLEKIDKRTVRADGITIEFDEDIEVQGNI